MRLTGHLVEVEWDGSVLRARATSADGRALLAARTDDGRLALPVAEIAAVSVRDAPRRVGGLLLVTDTAGGEHRLHYRRDTLAAFHALAAELDAASRPFRPVPGTPSGGASDADGTAPDPADGVDLRVAAAADVDLTGADAPGADAALRV